ncbi:AraC family transcriptional regulator [Flavobacterium sp.]|uniref:AraC family transcriptional regulator n=1 Tax=Flavobacterium sp. TaxID=239 RepID=UPI003D6C0910
MGNPTVLHIRQFDIADKSKEFYSNTIENHLATGHKNIHKPHRHNFYLTVLFTHGKGVHEIDFVKYDVKPGSLFFLNPGQMHHWELSEDISGFIFFHTQSFYDLYFAGKSVNDFPFFQSVQNTPALYLEENRQAYFKLLFEQMHTENQSEYIFKQQKIISLIDLVYIESTRFYIGDSGSGKGKQHSYSNKFQEFEVFLEKYFKEEKLPSYYAGLLNISPKHLNRIVQDMVGKTATDIILERIFLEAKRELIVQKLPFSEIAYDLGYDDYAYFSRLFKKKCGVSPSEFVGRYR